MTPFPSPFPKKVLLKSGIQTEFLVLKKSSRCKKSLQGTLKFYALEQVWVPKMSFPCLIYLLPPVIGQQQLRSRVYLVIKTTSLYIFVFVFLHLF